MTPPASESDARQRRLGVANAVGAYTLWGLLPFYWKAMHAFPMWETLAHRVLWSLVTIAVLLLSVRRFGSVARILRHPEQARLLGLSAFFIGCNWSLYVYAMDSNQVIQASLGYYINPLVTVGMGVFLLKEKLNRLQIAAVALAASGVLLLAWEHRGLPWIALGLAGTFSCYGLLKKRVAVEPLAGLGVESLWMLPFSLAFLASLYLRHQPHAFVTGVLPTLLLMGTGGITLAPLFFFAGAARRLPLSSLGFFQYLSPSIQLALAVICFHEPFTRIHGIAFGLIWAALGIYSCNAWRALRLKAAALSAQA
jgi:chloramphenicol-sensitive protein RarD